MVIKTITCHDVYNTGASLQAYALQEYLTEEGNEVQIIDYKPDYLSNHFSYTFVPNPKYRKPVLKQIYLLLKFPGRFRLKHQQRKKNFDNFREKYLKTSPRYHSFEELTADPPYADLYIAGSDQIWNPLFQNGKDPAFYLQFVPSGKARASYAASFAVDSVPEEYRAQIGKWLSLLDDISVREASGLQILENLGITGGQVVLDPVFLLPREAWEKFVTPREDRESYVFVYDFDRNEEIWATAEYLAERLHLKIYTLQNLKYGDRCFDQAGPAEFLDLIANAGCIVSNSFHATAFSIIFQKDFWVFNRQEAINTRMRDLTKVLGLENRLINSAEELKEKDRTDTFSIDYTAVEWKYRKWVDSSKDFLRHVLEKAADSSEKEGCND